LEGNKFTLKDPTQTLWQVIVSEQTRILTEIRIGNTVMVVGNKKDNDIEAEIVKPIQMRARPFMGSGLNGKVRGQNHQMY
jgi:starvation-inducible outer membrane lipoprotein